MNVLLAETYTSSIMIGSSALGFHVPTLGVFLGFAIRLFFVLAGLATLFFMLTGALAWVTSGGEKDKVNAAQKKITAAAVGVIIIIFVLAVIATMENVLFKRHICFGLTCPITIPSIFGDSSGNSTAGSASDNNTDNGVLFNLTNSQPTTTPPINSPTASPSGKIISPSPKVHIVISSSPTPFPSLILPATGGG